MSILVLYCFCVLHIQLKKANIMEKSKQMFQIEPLTDEEVQLIKDLGLMKAIAVVACVKHDTVIKTVNRRVLKSHAPKAILVTHFAKKIAKAIKEISEDEPVITFKINPKSK